MKYSPLFWPVELKGNTIHILDETALPDRLTCIKAKNYKQACQAIREMKTRAVGQVLLVMYTFLLETKLHAEDKNLPSHLQTVAEAINASRPTLPFKVLTDMVIGLAQKGAGLERSIIGFLEGLKQARLKQAQAMAALVRDGDTILTHCNVSGLMPLIAELAKETHKKITFFVTETRPYWQGSRLTAWELHRAGFDVTVIADNMVAQVMKEGKITRVIVGADHLAQNGDIANKIGTLQIALLAKHFTIPFYVLCPPPSQSASGADIKIEVRPDHELLMFRGFALAPKGVKGYYPAFDVTPKELITKHIYLEIPHGR